MRLGLIALVLLLALPAGASAQILCSEPLAPICTDLRLTAGASLERQQCIGDVETYRQELGEYIGCLESKLAAAEAQDVRMVEVIDCLADEACALEEVAD